jgi:hypothetical protein
MLGLLRSQYGGYLKTITTQAVHRDLGHATNAEILDHLPRN